MTEGDASCSCPSFPCRDSIVFLDSNKHPTMHDAIEVRLAAALRPAAHDRADRLNRPPDCRSRSPCVAAVSFSLIRAQGVPALVLDCDAHMDLATDIDAKNKMAKQARVHEGTGYAHYDRHSRISSRTTCLGCSSLTPLHAAAGRSRLPSCRRWRTSSAS